MMRAAIVFTPIASPTYMPLGLASLSAYMGMHLPRCELSILDLNIATWNRLADSREDYSAMSRFMRGRDGDFYDRQEYAGHLETWGHASQWFEQISENAKTYLEQNVITDELDDLLSFYKERILASEPELAGFSVLYPKQVIISLATAKYIKADSGWAGKIVFGGAMMSALRGEQLLDTCGFVDGVFDGEGEEGLRKLCSNEDFAEIPGLIFRGGDRIVRNRKPDTVSLSQVPMPSFEEFDKSLYFNPEPVPAVIFSRGCLWRKCRFCAHNFSYGGYRRRDIAEFIDYLSDMAAKGVRNFYAADQYVEAEDLDLLAKEITRRELKINYQVMCRPTAAYTPEILEGLSKSGCRWISWGVESGSQRLLDICGKGTRVEAVKKVITDSHKAGIANLAMMIFGLPGGEDTDLAATLDFLDDIADMTADITCSSFQLFDHTAFAANSGKYSIKITGREEILNIGGKTLNSFRLFHQEFSGDGTARPARGPMEIDQWAYRRGWAKLKSVFENLCCEHFLLYSSKMHKGT